MIRIRISEDAFDDLNQGFLFYEMQSAGLGDYFTSRLRVDIEGLKITAGIHPLVYQDYHRLPEPDFSPRDLLLPRRRCRRRLGGPRPSPRSAVDSRAFGRVILRLLLS